MIKAVFFDFDETLQDRTAAFERYMDGFFARFFPGVTGEELAEKKHQMRQSGNGGYVDRVEWYKGLIALWHWTDAPAAEALADHYDRTFGDCCVIFPDAVPMLQALRKKGIVTGVITNGPSYLQNHKMDESGLIWWSSAAMWGFTSRIRRCSSTPVTRCSCLRWTVCM